MACDLLEAGRLAEVFREVQPSAVVHAQALSDVDRCEREPALAEAMNVEATANLLAAARACEKPPNVVHLSTDYVFDGTKGAPYAEDDPPRPLSVYGRSKLKAEVLVRGWPSALVVRTSTLFGDGRMNFCDHIVQCLREGRGVEVFSDQTTSPTWTDDLAAAIAELVAVIGRRPIAAWPSRVVHLANAGGCTRLDLARRVAALTGGDERHIRPVRMADQQRPAPRPAYSALTTTYGPQFIGRRLRGWEDALIAYLRQRRWLS